VSDVLNVRLLVIISLFLIMIIPAFPRAIVPFLQTSHAESENKLTGVMVPLYSYPWSTWTEVANMKEAFPLVPIIAIVDPDNGPGVSQDQNFVSGISLLESAGVTVLGYVHTSFGYRTLSAVMTDVNSWKQMYSVNGIFFDEMASVTGFESYYSSLNSYAESLGYSLTVGNPSAQVPASYIGTLDNILIYENSGLPSESLLSSLGYQSGDFSSVSYNVPALNSSFLYGASGKVGYVYVTDQNLPNPYEVLPPYFQTLVSTLSEIDSPPTVSVNVQTVDSAGNAILGLSTVVHSGSTTILSGYSPVSFNATAGNLCEVTVENYGNYFFSHWSTGSTSNTIKITPSQASTLVAYYNNDTQEPLVSNTSSSSTSASKLLNHFLYDISNSYFSGSALSNSTAITSKTTTILTSNSLLTQTNNSTNSEVKSSSETTATASIQAPSFSDFTFSSFFILIQVVIVGVAIVGGGGLVIRRLS
jgi:hypothetical protein